VSAVFLLIFDFFFVAGAFFLLAEDFVGICTLAGVFSIIECSINSLNCREVDFLGLSSITITLF